MKSVKRAMLLYAVTDRRWAKAPVTLLDQIREALEGGATCLQLREKELSDEEFLTEAWQVKELCGEYHVPFIINDNVAIAKACDADGVHIGQHDQALAEARQILGPEKIIGVSAQTVEQAIAAERGGADYLGVGAMFATGTKPDALEVTPERLHEICSSVRIPVTAIGGISEHNIERLAGCGADGVALVSAIFAAGDVREASRKMRKLAEQIAGK